MVDGNHMLAGQTLTFDVEVVAIREAKAEEIEHGHIHQGGGCCGGEGHGEEGGCCGGDDHGEKKEDGCCGGGGCGSH